MILEEPKKGDPSFANNCLLARRFCEAGVRFIQLYDSGWDSHGTEKKTSLKHGFVDKCKQIDQPISALLTDLSQRGMLENTLVVWTGEFGRTPMRENRGGLKMSFIGRDHCPSAFTLWMAGGGVKQGFSYGETTSLAIARQSTRCNYATSMPQCCICWESTISVTAISSKGCTKSSPASNRHGSSTM